MIVIKATNPIGFDVDGTLVLWNRKKTKDNINIDYGDEKVSLVPHKGHIRFLKHCKERGDYVIVWSQNGWAHALQIVEKLGLEDYVDEVRGKCTRCVDDKDNLVDIVGVRIFLGDE